MASLSCPERAKSAPKPLFRKTLLRCARWLRFSLFLVREAGWIWFAPTDELALREAESRLGRRLLPSLRCFYSLSNGWRTTGRVIHDVLLVSEIG
jgi:hypothetical protein